jgi:hypothetical protein
MIIVLTRKDLLGTAMNKAIEVIEVTDTILAWDHVHRADTIFYIDGQLAKTLKDRTADAAKVVAKVDAIKRIEETIQADHEFATWED